MSNSANHLSIYLIVLFNAACHIMLIRRLRMDTISKWKFYSLTAGIPLLVMITMRCMVGLGVIHGRVAEQAGIERAVTTLASLLLIAGPFIATGAAVLYGRKSRGSCDAVLTR